MKTQGQPYEELIMYTGRQFWSCFIVQRYQKKKIKIKRPENFFCSSIVICLWYIS